jgi:hypothetical protein
MATMSKKGQGLAFVSILVLVAILYFIFRFNTETYGFIMQAGDEQSHLITSYVESAKAKSYVQIAASEAASEVVWNLSNKSKDAAALTQACDQKTAFEAAFKDLFSRYITMYSPSSQLIETSIPDYKFSFSCSHNGLMIEGYGYDESCKLQKNFPFPERPCADETDYTNCTTKIKFTQNYPGNACTWDQKLNCTSSLPEPNCGLAGNATDCSNILAKDNNRYCSWKISYSEKINVVSAPLVNYQFSIDADAHFIETVSGSEYQAFADAREKVV